MERILLLFAVIAIVAVGASAGMFGFISGVSVADSGPNPEDYVTEPGECWVPPQGDPLYDEHYAKNVNPQNCASFKVGEEGKQIKEETRSLSIDNLTRKMGMGTFLGIVIVLACLILAILLKR